jgi:hypothetical protein
MNQRESYFNVQYDEDGNIENGVRQNNFGIRENALRENALRENALRENALRENALRENALRENAQGQSSSLLGRIMLEAVSGFMNRVVRNLSTEIETNLMRSDIVRNRPKYVVIRYKNMPNKKEHTSCPICFDDYTDNCFVLETECKHYFHEECLEKWMERNNTCPICRTDLIV